VLLLLGVQLAVLLITPFLWHMGWSYERELRLRMASSEACPAPCVVISGERYAEACPVVNPVRSVAQGLV
jgi:hypothetical protein